MTWVRNWSLMSTSRVDEKSGKNQQKVAKMARNDSLSWCVKYAEYDFLMSHQLCTRHQSWISSISGVFLHFYGLIKRKCKKLSKNFIKTVVTGNNILYNKLTNADAFDVAKTHHVQAIFAQNDHISHDFQDGLSRNTNPAWYDRFYKMRQLRFVKGDCVQMLISGYYGFRVESKNVFAFR